MPKEKRITAAVSLMEAAIALLDAAECSIAASRAQHAIDTAMDQLERLHIKPIDRKLHH